jgi:hypothetical protein
MQGLGGLNCCELVVEKYVASEPQIGDKPVYIVSIIVVEDRPWAVHKPL